MSTEYYNESLDLELRKDYYKGFTVNENPNLLFWDIHRLLLTKHIPIKEYSIAKTYLHTDCDLHSDGYLYCVYTLKKYSPEELAYLENQVDIERRDYLNKALNSNSLKSVEDIKSFIVKIEREHPYNCEHVVPASWFDHCSLMKADLHHLFTSEQLCNRFRDHYPYFDFEEKPYDECGLLVGDLFEPKNNKGRLARSVLYYLVRYPNQIENNYSIESVSMLLKWHNEQKIDVYEKRRNATIQTKQGNRNIFIDYPELAMKCNFINGL